ncbi:hypothetical protein VPH35_060290 [Triticum aestivum]|uniref:Uncharacterized protein n=1 Tax=Aegilops tauschii subsp. strangulata TaxID=200361 RepID=A0A453F7S3_AEGTS
MASVEDQASAADLLGGDGDPAAFNTLLLTLMSASNADRVAAPAFQRLRGSHPEPLALRLAWSPAARTTPAELCAMAARPPLQAPVDPAHQRGRLSGRRVRQGADESDCTCVGQRRRRPRVQGVRVHMLNR